MKPEDHLGTYIKQKVKDKGLSVTEFGRRIHCTRRNVYEIFKKNSLDTDLVKRISRVLGSDILSAFYLSSSETTESEMGVGSIENFYSSSITRLKNLEVKFSQDTGCANDTLSLINNILGVIKSIQLNIHIQVNTLNELIRELEKNIDTLNNAES